MIINSLKLKNIRSYIEEEFSFPEGSIMLSGDIGAGKTTILLAVEFALFGIIRGQLSGGSLLRHGKKEGFVELAFDLEGVEIIIQRSLKRSSNTISQDSGFIVINGSKQDLSPVELKSKILELIGYPDELLTKSKSLIYRYTVYTPQEEMKHILFERQEERLDALRRIFDIDKYKRIKENILVFLKDLKMQIATFEGRTEDLEDKKKELKEYDENIRVISKKAKELEATISKIKKDYSEVEKDVKLQDEQIKEFEKITNKLEIEKNNLENKKKQVEEYADEILELKEKIEDIKKALLGKKELEVDEIKKKMVELDEQRKLLEDNVEKIRERETEFKMMMSDSERIVRNIKSLDECPTCLQVVEDQYKKKVFIRENKRSINLQEEMKKLVKLKETRVKELDDIRIELKRIDDSIRESEVLDVKQKQIGEYKDKRFKIFDLQAKADDDIKKKNEKIQSLKKQLEAKADAEKEQKKALDLLEKVREKLKSEDIKLAEVLRERQTIDGISKKVSVEIEKKETDKKQLSRFRDVQEWMHKYMLNITYMMEKQIMLRIHQEFNNYFQDWFDTIIEDENLNVRLDETFTPIIEQNGYETYLENLSGGEKTSVALAYRLALNKVINDFIGTIKTKDLLILDEPTDGFSSEQLDKIRDVLEKLAIKQIILVSHEPKLESYVDHILRVYKEEHESKVIA